MKWKLMKKLRKSVPLRKRQYSFAINVGSGPFFYPALNCFVPALTPCGSRAGPHLCLHVPCEACLVELLLIKCQNSNYHRWRVRKRVRGWLDWTSPRLPGAQEFKQSECYAAHWPCFLFTYLFVTGKERHVFPAFRAGLNGLTL